MNRIRRLALARLWHEANAFSPLPTTISQFQRREWHKGADAIQAYRGTATEMGGAVAFLDANPHWVGSFLRCTSAPPGGPVVQQDLDAIISEIIDEARKEDWDAIYVSLHGAISGTDDLGPDYTLLRGLRNAIGPHIPVAASFDMHACLDPRIAECADIVLGYKTYPHVDMFETAYKALNLLDRASQGARLRSIVAPVDMLPPSHRMRTDMDPMGALLEQAGQLTARNKHLQDITVFGAFAYADTPWTRSSISVCFLDGPDGQEQAKAAAEALASAMKRRHADFVPSLPTADQGLEMARTLLAEGTKWPVAVLENSDNPLSGGAGDTPGLFRSMLQATWPVPVVFASFYDPDLVERAHRAGLGAVLSAQLGARLSDAFGSPVPFTGKVVRLTDGHFTNCGPMERGRPEALGRTAVLQQGLMKVVVAETNQSVNDPAWCTLHDIDLSQTALFCVKAKNHFRASFGPLCGAIIDVDTPGPAPADLALLPYRHVPKSFLTPAQP